MNVILPHYPRKTSRGHRLSQRDSGEDYLFYFFWFIYSIQERFRKTFLISDAHVGSGIIAVGLTTPFYPFCV
jgi:hypothetical protein